MYRKKFRKTKSFQYMSNQFEETKVENAAGVEAVENVEGTKAVKKPYNIQEKKQKDAAYRNLIRAELADELYDKILNIIVVQKKYKDPDYSAKDLAKELNTNTRYLSAVVNSRFGMNYSCLLNEYRVRDAAHMLKDKRYEDRNIEEISAMVGFANRQSFYAAFYKNMGETPNSYRKKHTTQEDKSKKTAAKATVSGKKRGRKPNAASEK